MHLHTHTHRHHTHIPPPHIHTYSHTHTSPYTYTYTHTHVPPHTPTPTHTHTQELVADQPERFFVSEIVREQVFLQYRQEVPYAVSVACTDFKARPHAKDYVEVR